MRVCRDLELVEQLGSGIPGILENYGKECFRVMDNFIRMTFPIVGVVTPQDTPQVGPQVIEFLNVFEDAHNRADLQDKMGLSDR